MVAPSAPNSHDVTGRALNRVDQELLARVAADINDPNPWVITVVSVLVLVAGLWNLRNVYKLATMEPFFKERLLAQRDGDAPDAAEPETGRGPTRQLDLLRPLRTPPPPRRRGRARRR